MLSRYVHIRSLQCVKITCKYTERFLRNRSFCRATFFSRTLYMRVCPHDKAPFTPNTERQRARCVRGLTQKRMIAKCSDLILTRGY